MGTCVRARSGAKERAAILADEQFGAAILRDAARQGYMTACPAEKSGQKEFHFEYGEEFARHIEAFNPTFCKVLVRYNPEGDKALNRRQAARLLAGRNRRSFWFLHTPTGECWPVDDPVAWSLEHAHQPILERARDRLVTLDAADPQRVIRLVVRRCKLNLLELRPGRVAIHHSPGRASSRTASPGRR